MPESVRSLTETSRRPAPKKKSSQREFRPDYISFAPTFRCNLSCPHCCVPIEWTDRLDLAPALRFLNEARMEGIDLLGFTGGEPFLEPEFLAAIIERGSELKYRFDKIMTNGVWYRDETHLLDVLTRLKDCGFSGKIGLSIDKFHGGHTRQLVQFCRSVRQVFKRDNILALSYASPNPDAGLQPIEKFAKEIDAVIDWSDLLHRYLLVSPDFTMTLNWNHLALVERATRLPGNSWDGRWFEEDYCEGPGQALIINPKGEVKPCCGFASDLDQLTIGNIYTDSASKVIRNGREHPYVGTIFREGLSAIRDAILKQDPKAFPNSTSNHCFFCWYVLTKNLVSIPSQASGSRPASRLSLPMTTAIPFPAPVVPNQITITVYMVYDGKTVFFGRELTAAMPFDKGRAYLVNIVGPAYFELPERMTWTEYQSWQNRLHGEGYTLTSHTFSPCQSSCSH